MLGREILMAAAKRGLSDRAEDGLAQPALLVSSEWEEVAEEQGAQATLGAGWEWGSNQHEESVRDCYRTFAMF